MATFNLGQLRKNSISSSFKFLTPINFSLENYETYMDFSEEMKFKDKSLKLGTSLATEKNYYLKFTIEKSVAAVQTVRVYMASTSATTGEHFLKSCIVPKGIGDYVVETVFSPNGNYSEIIFELQRGPEDFNIKNGEYTGREIVLKDVRIESISNIMNVLPSVNSFKKIGVQGSPGLLMSINGEEIRVGRSGIYEILDGIEVTDLGFVVSNDPAADYFILDYQY